MRQLTSIVAVNRDGVIGCRNSLPWRVKSDMAFFKAKTSSNVVVMGRKTHDSLGRCLPNRFNIILSKQFGLDNDQPDCIYRNGIMEALASAERTAKLYKEVYVIGGSTMYSQFEAYVDRYLITVVDKHVDDGDAFFDLSILEKKKEWIVNRVTAKSRGEGDEAAFEIFELVARDKDARRLKRAAGVQSIAERAVKKLGVKQAAKDIGHIPLSFQW